MSIPLSHVADALKLQADGRLHLYEITPVGGGTIFVAPDNALFWNGHTYDSVPISLSGDTQANEGTPTPKMIIGQPNTDLLPFKGLIHDGGLDNAQIVKHTILLDDYLNNRVISRKTHYRVKRIDSYSRTQIQVTLAVFSAALGQTVPFRQYLPPDYPWVDL